MDPITNDETNKALMISIIAFYDEIKFMDIIQNESNHYFHHSHHHFLSLFS